MSRVTLAANFEPIEGSSRTCSADYTSDGQELIVRYTDGVTTRREIEAVIALAQMPLDLERLEILALEGRIELWSHLDFKLAIHLLRIAGIAVEIRRNHYSVKSKLDREDRELFDRLGIEIDELRFGR